MSHCTSFSGSTSQNTDVDDWYLTENYYVLKTGSTQNVETLSESGFSKNVLGFTTFPSHLFEYYRRMWVAYGLFPFFQVHKKISRDNLKFIWHAQPHDW